SVSLSGAAVYGRVPVTRADSRGAVIPCPSFGGRMRSTLAAIPLLAACTSGGDSNAFFCGQECADYYTIRAIDSVHAKVWSSVLANQPPGKDGTIPYDNLEIPCVAGSL